MTLVLHGLVDCAGCGETFPGRWVEASDTVQDMDEPPRQDQACPGCGHVQAETWPGWTFRSEAG